MDKEQSIKSLHVLEMLTVANEYCLFLEKSDDYSEYDIIDFLNKISPLLYLKGMLLPNVIVKYPQANERFVTEENWEGIFNNLRAKLGGKDEYWAINYSEPNDTEPVKNSLADNYADIYQDLKDFILLFQKPSDAAKENAVKECKALFKNHWGPRIIKANNYLHNLIYNIKAPNQDIL